jgi:hypothetical protein
MPPPRCSPHTARQAGNATPPGAATHRPAPPDPARAPIGLDAVWGGMPAVIMAAGP